MIPFEQGSDEWHNWRLRGLGSSDAPIIMGVSPWKTPYQLWSEKTGRSKRDEKSNWAMQRGNNLEPRARAHYEIHHERDMPPALAQHETYPFLRASLDGYCQEEKIVLEIKIPGKADHDLARSGQIPEKYIPQLDHQLLVTGAHFIHYYSFDGEADGALVVHAPDIHRIKLLLTAEIEFWKCIEFDEAPPFSDRDAVKIKDPLQLTLLKQWKSIKKRLDVLEAKEAGLRKEILPLMEHPISIGAGVRIQKSIRRGSVDYSKIEELNKIDLEKYRKKSTESWRMEIEGARKKQI